MAEVNKADEVKIDVSQDKAVKALDSARPYAESSTAQLTPTVSKGKEMEEVNKADEVKIDVSQDKAAKALDSARPYAESSTAQLTPTVSKGRSPVKKAKRKCFIHVVHYGLKQSHKNDIHYEPLLLSIGPYHHGNHSLQNMENHKFRYLNGLLDRKEGGDNSGSTEALKDKGEESEALNRKKEGDSSGHTKALKDKGVESEALNRKKGGDSSGSTEALKDKGEESEALNRKRGGDSSESTEALKDKGKELEDLNRKKGGDSSGSTEAMKDKGKESEALNRKKGGDSSGYIEALKEKGVVSEALNCYVDTFIMSLVDFGECLVHDGLFMLELFRKNLRLAEYEEGSSDDGDERKDKRDETGWDVLFSIRWMKPCLARDLLLFENQLPLSVLYKLFEMTEEGPSKSKFIILALGYFEFSGRRIAFDENLIGQLDDIPHLLGLVYNALVRVMPDQSNKVWESREFIRTAVALQEVGIKFARVYEVRFYRISFFPEDGVLLIPRLVIDDNTESFFRNVVAYEQYSEDYSLHQVTDYLRVMDCLINSAKDVELLRHCGIIDNRIGDDVKVSTMFNKLCSGVYFDQNEFLYAKMFDQVNEFCKKPWNVRMAKLKNDYFGNPWSVISFLAAATLLVLTLLQTVFTGISTF